MGEGIGNKTETVYSTKTTELEVFLPWYVVPGRVTRRGKRVELQTLSGITT